MHIPWKIHHTRLRKIDGFIQWLASSLKRTNELHRVCVCVCMMRRTYRIHTIDRNNRVATSLKLNTIYFECFTIDWINDSMLNGTNQYLILMMSACLPAVASPPIYDSIEFSEHLCVCVCVTVWAGTLGILHATTKQCHTDKWMTKKWEKEKKKFVNYKWWSLIRFVIKFRFRIIAFKCHFITTHKHIYLLHKNVVRCISDSTASFLFFFSLSVSPPPMPASCLQILLFHHSDTNEPSTKH